MSVEDQPDLLFLDTFSHHDDAEELNLDLVQFPKTVFVREIRIIPLGARVQGDFPGGVRLGATNPTQFHVDFFVNNLSTPGACTFESLGGLDYSQNGQIHMECITSVETPRIPTDGLVLRGCYTTITLAVYGNLTQIPIDGPGTNPQAARPSLPREVPPIQSSLPSAKEWNQEPSIPIPTYTGNVATNGSEIYDPGDYPETYTDQIYRNDFYEDDVPKDPRYHHPGHLENSEWDKDREMSCDRDSDRLIISPRLELERREGRGRRRSHDIHSRESSRQRDTDRRSRSRERDYIVQGEYRPHSRSRSHSLDRLRGSSGERDWERPYKKDDYRRRRESSYNRSRAGSYDKRSGSYERRSPYDKRATSYERKLSYDKRSPYDKRGSSYERRATSFDKQPPYDKKRLSPYNRVRTSSYESRSRSRDDPRKRPRTPSDGRRPASPRRDLSSPMNSLKSDEGIVEFDRSGKPVPRLEFYQSYRHKSSIRSPSQEVDNKPFVESQHSSLVTVPILDTATKPDAVTSPTLNQDDDRSLDEPFEPILSDEDICDDVEGSYMDDDYDINEHCVVDDFIKYYNPFKSEWVQYENVNKAYLLAPAKKENTKDVLNATFEDLITARPEFRKIHEISKLFKKQENRLLDFTNIENSFKEDWVHQCEELYTLVTDLSENTDIILRIFKEADKVEQSNEFVDIYNLLTIFCKIGLNYDFAVSHQMSTNKIRHMKWGIRLTEALVSNKHNGEVMRLLMKSGINVSVKLLELYSKEYMARSIRLLILQALDKCLSSKASVQIFMLETVYPKFHNSDNKNKLKNGYQALISIMQSDPLARIKFSVGSLIKKLNMYELLEKMNKLVLDYNKSSAEREEHAEIPDADVEFIASALDEILRTYRTQCFHISQPKRFLPIFAQFDINKDSSNEILLDFFNEHQFLDVCLYLLTCPSTCGNLVVGVPIYDLIIELIHSPNGLKFLYQNMVPSRVLFKLLMQGGYSRHACDEVTYSSDLTNYTDLQILGLEMAYRLRAMYHLKSISDLRGGKEDENELIDRLQGLFCLGLGNVGKLAVPDVIVMHDNAECIIEVLEADARTKGKIDSPSKLKSPAKGYAVDLIVAAVKFSAQVPFLKRYGSRIANIVKDHERYEPSVSGPLQELIPYLKPIENRNVLNGEDMAECVETLKKNIDLAPRVPGDTVTCLRVLTHLCISESEADATLACDSICEEFVDLKYKYNVLQLYSLDGAAALCSTLERLTTHFDQPSVHTSLFASVKGLQLAQMILPCLRLLDEMLSRVVRSRGSRYRDRTALPVLMKMYGLLRSYPPGCAGSRTAARGVEATVRALLAHAQPSADDAGDGDSVRRGPWTSLCSEAISYASTAPHTFLPGLRALSEILPLPLPMYTKRPLTERELSDLTNERRLWSAHLHTLGEDLVDMISTMAVSSAPAVVHLLPRVCEQIADLAPNAAAVVARAVVGAVVREASALPEATSAARVLYFLSNVTYHAPIKCAILYAAATGTSKSGDVFAALRDVFALKDPSASQAVAQVYAARALAWFCDAEVSLTPPSEVDLVVANSLPTAESLGTVLETTAECLERTTSEDVAHSILRWYLALTEHEHGFRQFRKVIGKKKDCFAKFMKSILDGQASQKKLDCLHDYISMLKIWSTEEVEGAIGRKSLLKGSELADLAGYSVGDDEHPLFLLEKKMKEENLEEDSLHIQNLTALTTTLSKFQPSTERPASPPPAPAVPPTPLVAQFASRSLRGEAEEIDVRLTQECWLSLPEMPEFDWHEEPILLDIAEVARTELAGAGGAQALIASLREMAGLAPTAMETAAHRPTATSLDNRVNVVPLNVSSVTGDTFRSRPPNTSRPPSLHVDDFTALERGPPGYGAKNNNRGLRRGGGADRGRFASAQPHPMYRHVRGRGAWDMPGHFGHFPPSPQYMMGGMGWGGGRMQRAPRHRSFMR